MKNVIRSKVLAALLKEGKIPLNQIGAIACDLMQNKDVSRAVCNKLQYLFIDEFQDVDITQLDIFEKSESKIVQVSMQ